MRLDRTRYRENPGAFGYLSTVRPSHQSKRRRRRGGRKGGGGTPFLFTPMRQPMGDILNEADDDNNTSEEDDDDGVGGGGDRKVPSTTRRRGRTFNTTTRPNPLLSRSMIHASDHNTDFGELGTQMDPHIRRNLFNDPSLMDFGSNIGNHGFVAHPTSHIHREVVGHPMFVTNAGIPGRHNYMQMELGSRNVGLDRLRRMKQAQAKGPISLGSFTSVLSRKYAGAR